MCIRGISLLVTSLAMAAATFGSAAAQSTVKIGMVMPLTGTLAAAGQQVVAGAHFYMAEHGNMVAGKQVELVVRDDGSSAEVGRGARSSVPAMSR
jgi:branched-chain amino acid transport system substrate-binding protein